jgi:TRAP-type C4-dicarboxylate transport system permease small subunit
MLHYDFHLSRNAASALTANKLRRIQAVMAEGNKFLSTLNRGADIIEKVINFFICVFIGLIAMAVVVGVFGRMGNIPVVWLGELSTYSTIWAAFFGLATGYRNGLFARVDIITHIIPSYLRHLEIVWDILSVIIMGIIVWSCRDYIAYVARSGTESPELNLPLYLVYMGPVLGYIFTSIFCLENVCNKLAQLKYGIMDTDRKEMGGC